MSEIKQGYKQTDIGVISEETEVKSVKLMEKNINTTYNQ